MEPQELPAYPLASSTTFGSTKREILLVLKREGQSDLQSLAEHLHISKMAVHKHIQELEDQGMIQRVTLRGAKGRPRHGLQLAPKASSLFPKALRRRDLCSSSLHRRKAWTKSCRGRFASPAIRNTPRLQGTRQCRNVGWSCPPTCPTPGPGGLHSRRQEARVFQVRDSRTQLSNHRHRRKLLGSMHSRE